MKTLSEVLNRAVRNRKFADELKLAAKNAVNDGLGSHSWRQLMSHFAQSAAELDELSDLEAIKDKKKKRYALETVLTWTSALCGFTIYDVGHRRRAARAVKKAKPAKKSGTKAKRARKSGAKTK